MFPKIRNKLSDGEAYWFTRTNVGTVKRREPDRQTETDRGDEENSHHVFHYAECPPAKIGL